MTASVTAPPGTVDLVIVGNPAGSPVFRALAADPTFTQKLAESRLILQIIDEAGEIVISAHPDGPRLRLEFASGVADQVWSGRLPLMHAIVQRKLRLKGPVAQVRRLGELIPSIITLYRELS